jgi:hypothetical protein
MYFVHWNWNFIETSLYVQYIIFLNYPKLLVCSYVSELIACSIASSTKQRNWISRICYKQMVITRKP